MSHVDCVKPSNPPARKPLLYRPELPAGAHRLGKLGLPDLAGLSPDRVYAPAVAASPVPARSVTVGDYYRMQPQQPPAPARPITVGDYYRMRAQQQASAIGRVLHGIVELAPPVLLGEMAYQKIKHGVQAHDRIYNLPWDPAGKWRLAAERIRAEEHAAGNRAIANLPLPTAARATGRAIVDGTVAAGRAVGTAVDTAGDFASRATLETIRAGRETGRGIMRGLLTGVALTGQGMVDFARRSKPAFE